ncbi:MAG: DUF6929 family protein [Chitinophagaceae bacterium]
MEYKRIFFKPKNLFNYLLLFAFFFSCKNDKPKLIQVTKLNHYSSGSGLAYFDGQLYIAGDDASFILKTDSDFNRLDSIILFPSLEKRIPKEKKADIESIAFLKKNEEPFLFLAGSGSLSPYRDSSWIINPVTKEKKVYLLDTFYNRIRNEGIRDLNIEGMTVIPSGMVLASRGNKSFPKNYLIFTSHRFWEQQEISKIRIVKAGVNNDTSIFNGISGLDYSPKTDQLLLTISTENTYNSIQDGSIGKSYLWIINDISSKKRLTAINPDRIIDLDQLDSRFKGQKIESVCILSENRNKKELALVADDDQGGTVLFRIII